MLQSSSMFLGVLMDLDSLLGRISPVMANPHSWPTSDTLQKKAGEHISTCIAQDQIHGNKY